MKSLKNTTTSIVENGKSLTFADLAKACVNRSSAGYFLPQEMRVRMKVLEVLEEAPENAEIGLEDAYAAKLVECAEQMVWPGMHKDILAFHDAVDELKS